MNLNYTKYVHTAIQLQVNFENVLKCKLQNAFNLFYYLYVNFFTALPVDSQRHKAMKGDVSKFQVCDILRLPYGIGQIIIFSCCGLFFFFFFFSSPNLSCCILDVCHTSTHAVALVRISDAGLKPAACGSLKTQDAKKAQKIAIWAPSHNFVGLYLRK